MRRPPLRSSLLRRYQDPEFPAIADDSAMRKKTGSGKSLGGNFCAALAAAVGAAASCRIRWAHGVNSRQKLRDALQDPHIHMLEADVMLGELQGHETREAPGEAPEAGRAQLILSHYPTSTTSDLCMEELLCSLMRHNATASHPKGLKLDFKQPECVRATVRVLLDLHARFQVLGGKVDSLLPAVFFNADVVRGSCLVPQLSGRFSQPFPLEEFIGDITEELTSGSQDQRKRPRCALSLGWTPGLPLLRSGCQLTDEMADGMLASLPLVEAACSSGVLQHVTFAVSAACARESEPALSRMLAIVDSRDVDASLSFFTPTFGLGVTDSEAEYLNRYPVCPPDRLFLDLRRRPKLLVRIAKLAGTDHGLWLHGLAKTWVRMLVDLASVAVRLRGGQLASLT